MTALFNKPESYKKCGIENIYSQIQPSASVLSANNTPIKSIAFGSSEKIAFLTD
jgi:hypothetical protein